MKNNYYTITTDHSLTYRWKDDNGTAIWITYNTDPKLTSVWFIEKNGQLTHYKLPIIIHPDENDLSGSIKKIKTLCLLK
jgi:hypothetical protein